MYLIFPKPSVTPSRLSWIDYDKGISIILVCYLHLTYLFQYYFHVDPDAYWILKYSNIFLYGFRMPLFFMISGVLLQGNLARKGFSGYIKNRFNTIFYPLLVWGFIRVTLQLAVGNLSPKHGSPILYLYILTDPRKIAPLWYLHALFCISVIYAIVKVKLRQSALHNLIFGLLLYVISDYFTTQGIETGFLTDILRYYVFFAAGDLISGMLLSDEARKFLYSRKIILILLIPFALVQTIAMKYNIAHRNVFYVENGLPMLYLLQGLIGCGFSIAFSFTAKMECAARTEKNRIPLIVYLLHALHGYHYMRDHFC